MHNSTLNFRLELELSVVGAWHPTVLKSNRDTRSGATSPGKSELFRLAAGLLHQFGPPQGFLADERCELRWRVSHGLEIDNGELLLYVGKLHDVREFAVNNTASGLPFPPIGRAPSRR